MTILCMALAALAGSNEIIAERLAAAEATLLADRIQLQVVYERGQGLQEDGRYTALAKITEDVDLSDRTLEWVEVQREHARLSARYGPQHPEMIAVVELRASVEREVADAAQTAIQDVQTRVELMRQQGERLRAERAKYE